MWPTIYIPSGASIPGDGLVDYTCGIVYAANGVGTVPNPTNIADGQIQVVIASYSGNSSPIYWPTNYSGYGNFDRIFDGYLVPTSMATTYGGYGRYRQHIYWREYSDGDDPFQYTAAAGFMYVAYVSLILERSNLTDPILNLFAWAIDDSFLGPHPCSPIQGIEVAKDGDLILQSTSPWELFDDTQVPDDEDVEFTCCHNLNVAGLQSGHSVAGLYGRQNKASNLLTYSRTCSSSTWTHVNMTVTEDVAYGSNQIANCELKPTSASGLHYVEHEADLEAGKDYTFAVAWWGIDSSPATMCYLSYEKPDTTEHGVGARAGSSQSDTFGDSSLPNMTGSTEVLWNTDPAPSKFYNQGADIGLFGGISTIRCAADTTGTYKFRIHVTTQGQDPLSAHGGNTGRPIYVTDTVLQEGPAKNHQVTFVPNTTGTPILPGTVSDVMGIPHNLPDTGTHLPRGVMHMIVRRSGGKRPTTRLTHVGEANIKWEMGSDWLTTGDSRRWLECGQPLGRDVAHANQVVHQGLSHKKYYFEVAFDATSSWINSDDHGVGFALAECSHLGERNNPYVRLGLHWGQYVHSSTGTTSVNGTDNGTTDTAWSDGDIIGCGINFTDWEITFYRNGTLVRTVAIAANENRNHFWTPVVGIHGPSTWSYQIVCTANFKGPFGGRKPSGFTAFDFDNEVS